VLASCGGGSGGDGGSTAGGECSSTGKTTSSGKSTTGASSGGGGKYGSSPSATTTTTNGASGGTLNTIVIKETKLKLSPFTVTLNRPGTYAFKAENKGSTEHSLEIDGEGVKSKGGEVGEAKLEQTLNPGQSGVLTVTFQESGTFEMYCPGHRPQTGGHERQGGQVALRERCAGARSRARSSVGKLGAKRGRSPQAPPYL
jgi:uncharacterized cupredoxin-like copper-binding protein